MPIIRTDIIHDLVVDSEIMFQIVFEDMDFFFPKLTSVRSRGWSCFFSSRLTCPLYS